MNTPPGTTNLSPDAAYEKTLLGQFDRRYLSTRPGHIFFAGAVAAALLIPCIQFVSTIREIDTSLWREAGTRHRTALGRWLPTAGLLVEGKPGESPYGYGHWFPTPPLVLLSLVPLWKIGYVPAGIIWAALKVAGLIGAAWFALREMSRVGLRAPLGVLLATTIFGIRPIISDLQHGNLNIFMMIWLTLAWGLYLRGSDIWAGLFVALAIVTKVTPGLVLVYFLYNRAWRVCLGAGFGLVLFFLVLPGLLLGFSHNLELLSSWFQMLVAPYAIHGYATLEIPNQSLYGVLMRLLSNAGILGIEHMPTDEALAAGMEDMARPDSIFGRLLRPAISLSLVAALAWGCRTAGARRGDVRRLLEYGLVLLAMLLLSERTWKHHATTLPLMYLGTWLALTCIDWSPRFRAWFVAGLIAQLVCLLLLGEELLGDDLADRVLDGGFFCWGLLLCFVQGLVMLRCMNRRGPAEGKPTAAG